ncbi:MAG: class I SAM-dependent methyltransferase [Phycisphaerales bacterium]|nr:class I SAM-dependent methyltransferase [Phycisphaerae bacterium]NNM26893.1 class I SAM-dependent methyltransferase [Phycisphaerales bacterium]
MHESTPAEETFRGILDANVWRSDESRSGTGSSLTQTRHVRGQLPALLRRWSIRTMLDIPCGDCHWISHVDLDLTGYVGADVLPELVERNRRKLGEGPQRRFVRLDLTRDELPAADLILCRDCLVHFSYADIHAALTRITASGARYLLSTVFTGSTYNKDIETGDWRQLNLLLPPFALPPPLELINEGCTEGDGKYADKSLALWRIADLRAAH